MAEGKIASVVRNALALADELGMRPRIAHSRLGLGRLHHRIEPKALEVSSGDAEESAPNVPSGAAVLIDLVEGQLDADRGQRHSGVLRSDDHQVPGLAGSREQLDPAPVLGDQHVVLERRNVLIADPFRAAVAVGRRTRQDLDTITGSGTRSSVGCTGARVTTTSG